MRATRFLSLAPVVGSALAETHYLFSGFFAGTTVVGLEFDDDASSLTLVNNITTEASSGSKWIAINKQLNHLYVATTGFFQSYAITSDLSLTYEGNVSLSSSCSNANYIAVSTASPYTVFGAPYSGGCSSLAISVDESGALDAAFSNLTYDSAAGVHGLAVSADNNFVYSADDMGNAVWVHSYDSAAGTVEEVQYLAAPTGADPRHLTVHPKGNFVYVVFEAASEIGVYARDNATGELVYSNTTYPLLPSSFTNSSSYWADEVLISQSNSTSPKYLIAATRSRTTSIPGYVSAFALDADTGAITEQLFLLPTTGSGGSANSVTPAGFSEDYFAITDSGSNFVEVWKINGSSAEAVAHVDLDNGPANVVWYN